MGHRIMLTVAIIIIILILLACIGYMSERWEQIEQVSWSLAGYESRAEEQEKPICVIDDETRERLRSVVLDALDEALQDQIKSLFIVWMKDERGQPGRARVGVDSAIRAHQTARKNAVEWNPPYCKAN